MEVICVRDRGNVKAGYYADVRLCVDREGGGRKRATGTHELIFTWAEVTE